MLVGGDLGFLSRVVVAAFLLLVWPLLGFLVRRKWRHAVSRREEIDRLLVAASEEAARAELEAAGQYGFDYSSYSFGSVLGDEVPAAIPMPAPVPSTVTSVPVARQLPPYQCAQCFSPASTRCSQCKAVRYCSGKCQIIHWRLGHKDECHPPFNSNHGSNDKGTNDFKVFRQEANEGFAEPTWSKPSISRASNTDVMEGKHLTDDGSTNSDSEFSPSFSTSTTSSESFSSSSISDDTDGFDRSVGAGSSHTETCQTNSDHHKPQFLEPSTVASAINAVSSSTKSGHVNPGADENTKSKSSNSRVSSVDGSSESSLPVSSVPSPGFWEGAARYSRSKVVDASHPRSEDVIAFNISDSQLPTNRYSEMARTSSPSVDKQGPKAKPSDGAQLLQVKDNVELKRSSLRPESHEISHLNLSSVRSASSYKECRRSVSTGFDACKVEHLVNNDTLRVNALPKTSNNSIEGLKNVSHTPKARQVEFLPAKAPDSHPSSINRRHDFQGAKSTKIDSAQIPACSLDLGGESQSSKSGLKSSVLKVVDQLKPSKLSRNNSLGAWSEIGGRYNNKGLFPYELFVKLFNSNKVELRPFGLTNIGNSCYANAVLQCLAFTPPFTAYFLQGFHSKGCAKKDWCFNCEFESLVLKAKDGNSPLSPIRITSHLENIGSSLSNGREEDAHEFLRYVIETMQSVCLKEAGVRAPCSLEEQTSLIGLTFGGFLRSKIECLRCRGKSERHERIMDLTVEIDGDITSLEEALKQFTHTEILDGENKYHCSRCKSYEKARKKLKISEAPNVLTIALKRFQSGKFGKLNKTITFPDILNLASYMSGTSDKSPIYRLYGVIVHLDHMEATFSGHYVCYVKNFQNMWFRVNDSKVEPMEIGNVLSAGAYMLLYSRCSPRAPKLIRSLTSHDSGGQKSFNSKSSSRTNSWDLSKGNSTNDQPCREGFNPIQVSSWPHQTIFEDSSSDKSSSLFSEGGSYSTESSYRDSISTEDFVDQCFGEPGGPYWMNFTDSDTSSSSSSPSPYSRHSRLSNLEHYTSRYPEMTSGHADSAVEDRGLWTGTCDPEVSESKHCRNLGCSSSKQSSSRKLGSDKPYGNMKYR